MRIAIVAPVAGRCFAAARACAEVGEVEILTTCSRDDRSWRDDDEPGLSWLGTVALRRFRTDHPRVAELAMRFDQAVARGTMDRALEERWVQERGPCSWALLDHLGRHSIDFDAFAFFGLAAATTVFGLPPVADRAILVTQPDDGPASGPLPGLLHEIAVVARAIVVASAIERVALAPDPLPPLGVVRGEPAAELPELLRRGERLGLFLPRQPA